MKNIFTIILITLCINFSFAYGDMPIYRDLGHYSNHRPNPQGYPKHRENHYHYYPEPHGILDINLSFGHVRGYYQIQYITVWIPERRVTYIDIYGNQIIRVIPGYWERQEVKVWINY